MPFRLRHVLGAVGLRLACRCLAASAMLLAPLIASGNDEARPLVEDAAAASVSVDHLYGKVAFGLLLALVPVVAAFRFARLSAVLRRTIAESEQITAALRESEALYRSILQASPNGITVTDLQGRIRKASPAALAMFGFEREDQVVGHALIEYIAPEEHERVASNLGRMLQGTLTGPNDYRAARTDGSVFDFEVNGEFIRGERGEPTSMVFIGRDVTKRKQEKLALEESNRLLASLSITDALTGLANRRRLDEALAREHARLARSGAELSMILLDIDHFKAFNDNYGHVSGDDCLRRIAGVIAACAVRPADLPARYGGEEFACILPETDRAGAVAIAEKIRLGIMELAIPHRSSSIADRVTASLGVVTIACAADKPASEIIILADQLLYKAKSGGRNRVESSVPPLGGERSLFDLDDSLPCLVWKDDFCSGNPLIDDQHRQLFRSCNELLEATASSRPLGEIAGLVERLLEDAARHFSDEEMALERVKFPGLKEHAKKHAQLLHEGRKLALALDAESEAPSFGGVFTFLVHEMVFQHMLGADREFFPLVGEAAASQEPA